MIKEIEMIRKELKTNSEDHIDDYEYFHVGEFIEKPNQCGCFKRNEKWYI